MPIAYQICVALAIRVLLWIRKRRHTSNKIRLIEWILDKNLVSSLSCTVRACYYYHAYICWFILFVQSKLSRRIFWNVVCYSLDNNFPSEHVKGVYITTVLFMKALYWQRQQHSLNWMLLAIKCCHQKHTFSTPLSLKYTNGRAISK